jgi:hypothetical protein
MSRANLLMTLGLVGALALSGQASAEPPRQADIDACNQEATAAVGPSIGVRSGHGDTGPMSNSSEFSEINGRQDAASARAGQTFAACLAKHGYYKGYYR